MNNLIGIKHGRNFRELGGYVNRAGKKIKHGKLLRSGHLADLSENDLNLLKNFNVKQDIDFRSLDEQQHQPDRVPAGAEYRFNPVFSQDLTESTVNTRDLIELASEDPNYGFNHMMEVYRNVAVNPDSQNAYKQFFQYLLANTGDSTLLFHCTAGKDRTGVGAFLLMNALDVDYETIKTDYLTSNLNNKDYYDQTTKTAEENNVSPAAIQSIQAMMSVDERYLAETVKTINENYGDVQVYAKNILNIGKDEKDTLKQIYLD